MSSLPRSRAVVCVTLCALAALPLARAADDDSAFTIAWDPELALERDRTRYDGLLRSAVGDAATGLRAGLGFVPDRPVAIRVHTPAGYAAMFGADMAQHVGAHYQGREIHVNGGRLLDGAFASLLVHEMVHALLDHRGTAHRLPLWLNEGLAEHHAWRSRGVTRLQPGQVAELQRAQRDKKLWPLPTAGRLTPYGYLQCLAVVQFLNERSGTERVQALVVRLLDDEPLEPALRGALGLTWDEFELTFAQWVQGLR